MTKSRTSDIKRHNIVGYEGLYQITESGEVYSLDRDTRGAYGVVYTRKGKKLKMCFPKKGYPLYSLTKNGKPKTCTVHRMLAQAFIPNPDNKLFVNHLDGDKTNFNLTNLEWCTPAENMRHAVDNNLISKEHHKTRKGQMDSLCSAGFTRFECWIKPGDREKLERFVLNLTDQDIREGIFTGFGRIY